MAVVDVDVVVDVDDDWMDDVEEDDERRRNDALGNGNAVERRDVVHGRA